MECSHYSSGQVLPSNRHGVHNTIGVRPAREKGFPHCSFLIVFYSRFEVEAHGYICKGQSIWSTFFSMGHPFVEELDEQWVEAWFGRVALKGRSLWSFVCPVPERIPRRSVGQGRDWEACSLPTQLPSRCWRHLAHQTVRVSPCSSIASIAMSCAGPGVRDRILAIEPAEMVL